MLPYGIQRSSKITILELFMAASIIINRWTGPAGSETKTDITSINTVANANDTHQPTASSSIDPIRVPASGTNYSYWVSTRLSAVTSPSGTINNIRWYTDGSNNFGTGVTCRGNTSPAYVEATGVVGLSGDYLDTINHPSLSGPTADVFIFNYASPFPITGSITNPDTGDFGHFMVYQVEVDPTAGPGVTNQETFTWIYDET
jgi:hypothetical protein